MPEAVKKYAWSFWGDILKFTLALCAVISFGFTFLLRHDDVKAIVAEAAGTKRVDEKVVRLEDALEQAAAALGAMAENVEELRNDSKLAMAIATSSAASLKDLTLNVEQLAAQDEEDGSPPLTFLPIGNHASDMDSQGRVILTWSFIKERDCGAPKVEVTFVNSNEVIHKPESVNILSPNGTGVNYPADGAVHTISYQVKIPADDGVKPGPGKIKVVLTYEHCRKAGRITSPELDFELTDNGYLN